MTRRQPSYAIVSLLLLVMLAIAACAPAPPPATPTTTSKSAPPTAAPTSPPKPAAPTPTPAPSIQRGGTLRVAVQNDFDTMDPLYSAAAPDPLSAMYSPWVDWLPDEKGVFGPKPALVTDWQFDATGVTFKLAKGVKFQDGSDWNARVAQWNWKRMLESPKSRIKNNLPAVDTAKGVQVVDDYTIRVPLKQPDAAMLYNLSRQNALPVSQAAVEKMGEEAFGRQGVGTGPFQFVEWTTGDHITVKKFDGYWRKGADGQPLPYLDGVVFRLIVDDSVRFLEMKAGNEDITSMIHPKDIPGVKANPDLVLVEPPGAGNLYRIIFGAKGGPFTDNLKLRQAALYAIDKEAMAKTLGLGSGQPMRYLLPQGTLGYDDSLPYYWYNPQKAKELLAEAGYPTGVDVTFDVIQREVDVQMAEMLKQMWDSVGIRTTIDRMERLAWVQRMQGTSPFDIGSLRSQGMGDDPDLWFRMFYDSKGRWNLAGVNLPAFDKALDAAIGVYDAQKRAAMYHDLAKMDFDTAYYASVWVANWNWVYNKRVQNFQIPSNASYTGGILDSVWLKP